MRRIIQWTLTLLVPLALAVPAQAGTVYIPHPGSVEIDGVEYETQIWASNTDRERVRRLEHFFLRSIADGTERTGEPVVVRLQPGRTTRLEVASDMSGMVEIFAAPQVVINARLVQTLPAPAPLVGTQLPVIDSDSVSEAGEIAHLQGWERIEGLASTTFGLANLGQEESQCEVRVFRTDGSQIASTALLTLRPLSHLQFDEALKILQAGDVKDVRGEVTCDQPFFPYVTVYGQDPAGVVFNSPSSSGKSTFVRPGDIGDFEFLSDHLWSATGNVEWGPWQDRTGHEGFHDPGGPRFAYKKIEINGVTYDKGVSWQGRWRESFVEWELGGKYALFTALVRIDDEERGNHEWGVVNPNTGQIQTIPRPIPASESATVFRIGAGGSLQVWGDGQLLHHTPEFYAYGQPVPLEVDVSGVQTLRLVFVPDHSEQVDAPHRIGGLPGPAKVIDCPWWDLLVLADAKLHPAGE